MSLVGFKAQNHGQQTAKRGAKDDVDDRGTLPEFIAELEARYLEPFTLDVAAAKHNAKAKRYYTRKDNGLERAWYGNVWCNPPYSDCGAWVRKAWTEWDRRVSGLSGAIQIAMGDADPLPKRITMLLPANRVEQKWWQELVEPFRDRPDSDLQVEFLPGRMRFIRPGVEVGPKGDRPPFGCCLLIWERS